MPRAFTLLLTISLSCGIASAQDCGSIDFTTPQFDVEVENDVFYGTAERFDGGIDSLRMNIHRPVGDGQAERPLLIAIHGGAFLSGDRSDMDEVCSWYAARGYVAATVSYRLGFHPPQGLPNPYAYDEAEVLRASYRAQQDVKGAIRLLRARHALDHSSTENVFVYGVSAGGITGMHVAYATENDDRPAPTFALSAVNLGTQQSPRPDLGPIEGSLNAGTYDASVKACVSYFGALLDTSLIGSTTDPALFTYHQTGDPIVGCGHQQALWGAPLGISANYPVLFGSCAIEPRMQHLGFTEARYEHHPHAGTEHDIHDIPLVDGWAAEFLARQLCPEPAGIIPGAAPTFSVNITLQGIEVTGDKAIHALTLLDASGRSVATVGGPRLAVADLPSGIYTLIIQMHGPTSAHRVLVMR